MDSGRVSRRRFITSAAVTVSLPLLPSLLHTRRARAAECAPAKRFIAYMFPNGHHMPEHVPTGTGSGSAWALPPMLEALSDLKSELLFVSGLENQHRRRENGDHAIGVPVGGPLDPRGGVVGRAKLLNLPGTVGFEGVGREHESRVGERPRQTAREVGVPCVTVDDVRPIHRAHHHQITRQSVQQPLVPRILRRNLRGRIYPAHAQIPAALILTAKCKHVDIVDAALQACQLPGQILDVNARAAVNVRWIFVCKQRYAHRYRVPGDVR